MPDVVVVGGGILGAACAHELATRGLTVTLIERDELAAGASGRNHGLMLTPQDPRLVPMFTESLDLYRAAAADAIAPFSMDEEPVGFLIVAGDEESEREAGRSEAEAIAAQGVGLERLDAEGLRAIEPHLAQDLVEGWLLDDGRRLDPAALTVSLALASGTDIHRHTAVRSLLLRGDRVAGVVTDIGEIEADEVVVAAGPWTPPLLRPLGLALPVVGARGWLVHVQPAAPEVSRLIERAGWHAVGGEEALSRLLAGSFVEAWPRPDVGTLLQPNPDGTMLIGGSRQRAVTAEPEDPGMPRELVRRAVTLVPELVGAAVLSAWWGLRPVTPDGLPFVGRLAEGLVVATGHGSQGVILGGGTARLVAALLSGDEPPFDPAPFDPARD